MSKYKISDLEKLSGVKAHTIRMWEKRYNMPTPFRTDTNIRYYDDLQLRKFLNVVLLKKAGNKISKIVKLSDYDFNSKISNLLQTGTLEIKEEILINQLISSGLTYDEFGFEKAFSNSILSFGLLNAYKKVFYPMLVKVGLLWTISELSVSQEHFVTSLIRQKILTAIDAIKLSSNSEEKWVLFLPEGEIHDLGLLVASYALRKRGHKVTYLGKNVKLEDLYEVSENVNATHYLSFVVRHNQRDVVNKYLSTMNSKFKSSTCYICCDSSFKDDFNLFDNQNIISNFDEFLNLVQ